MKPGTVTTNDSHVSKPSVDEKIICVVCYTIQTRKGSITKCVKCGNNLYNTSVNYQQYLWRRRKIRRRKKGDQVSKQIGIRKQKIRKAINNKRKNHKTKEVWHCIKCGKENSFCHDSCSKCGYLKQFWQHKTKITKVP